MQYFCTPHTPTHPLTLSAVSVCFAGRAAHSISIFYYLASVSELFHIDFTDQLRVWVCVSLSFNDYLGFAFVFAFSLSLSLSVLTFIFVFGFSFYTSREFALSLWHTLSLSLACALLGPVFMANTSYARFEAFSFPARPHLMCACVCVRECSKKCCLLLCALKYFYFRLRFCVLSAPKFS